MAAFTFLVADSTQDLMRKEYMGEFSAPVDSWFHDGEIRLWHENLPVSILFGNLGSLLT